MLTALILPFALQAQTLTVCNGTSNNQYIPFYGYNGDAAQHNQMIYPAESLSAMNGESILQMVFYIDPSAQNGTYTAADRLGTWTVSLGETTATTLNGLDSTTTLTQVYQGYFDCSTGTLTLEFDVPYLYNGGNLLVDLNHSAASWNRWYFLGENTASTVAYNSNTSNTYSFLPKCTFAYGNPPSCIPVTNLAINATQTTSSSLTLTWADAQNTGASYNVYMITPSDTTLLDNVTSTNYTATGLNANTLYTLGVAADCGGGDLAQIRTASGRTACGAMSLPWVCGFESDEIQSTSSATALPWCSQRFASNVSSPNYPYSYSPSSSSYLHSGSRCLYFYGTTSSSYPDTMALVLPQVDVTTYPMNGNRISFWARISSSSYSKNVYVCTMSDPTDMSTLTIVDSIQINTTAYTKFSLALSAANPTDAYLVLAVLKGNGTVYMDDMTFDEIPSCMEVSDLAITATTSSSITLGWNDAYNTGANYNVYMITPTDTTLLDNVTTTSYTATDLNPNTNYVFGVAADCGGGDLAQMIIVNGLTDCGIETMPWSESFDAWSSKSPCWSFLSGAYNGGNGTPTAYSSAWTINSTYGNYITISGKALTMNLYSSNKYWAVTPPITITSDNAVLSVDVAVAAWSDATPNYDDNDTLAFAVSTDNGATYTNLMVYNGSQLNALGNSYTTILVPAAGYNGQTVRFAIYGGSTSGTSPYDNRIAIDNVSVGETPDCMPVAGLTVSDVTAHTATLTWSGNADGYTIWDMSDTTVYEYASDDTTVVIYALDSETSYTFGVTANCGIDESDIRTASFTTLISCPAPTGLVAALTPGDGTVATLTWTSGSDATAWQICLDNDTNNLIDATSNSYDLTGLTAEQAHTAKVRAVCDVDDMSAWSDEISFTPTDAYLLTVNDGSTTNIYVPIYGLWVDDITKSQFIIPANMLTGIQYGYINKLTFYSSDSSKNWGAATFNVYLTETDNTTIDNLADYASMTQVYAGSLSITNNVMEVTISTPYQYTGGNLMVGFLQTVEGNYSSCSWYGVTATGASLGGYGTSVSQRNFLPKTTIAFTPGTMPTCLPVNGLAVSNVSSDEATLTWNGDADSYNVYAISGTDTTFVQNVSATTVTLTGLNAMTQYTYGVRGVCSGDESDIRTVNFTTACAAISLPYTETFASTSNTRDCWTLVASANIGGSDGMGFVTVGGREVLRFSSYSNASDYNQYGYSPLMNVSSNATNLLVKVVYATYGNDDQLNFGYVTATDTVWDPTIYTTAGSSDFQNLTFIVPATATQLAVHYYGNYQYYGWIDSVVVNELSGDYCYPVSNLTAGNATTTSITLNWNDANNSGATYTIYNMADNSVVASNVNATTYTVSGLNVATTYTFGVTADCSADNSSDMTTVTVSTECGDITTLPYNEGFEAGLGCWTTVNGSSTNGEPWSANDCASLSSVFPHGGNYVASSWSWKNSTAMQANAWLISPKFVLPNTTEGLTLTWWEATNSSYPDGYSVVLSTTTNDTAAFTTVVYPYATATGDWTIRNIDLSAYAGQSIYLAFHHADYDKNYLLIDDISLFVGGFVPPAPDTLTVTFAVNDATMGTTVPAPGSYQYIAGDTVSFNPVANPGYHFTNWVMTAGGVSDTLPSNYVSVYFPANAYMSYGSMTLTALFEAGNPDSTTVTYAVNDATMGSITPAPGTYTAYVGNSISATATPNAGYQLGAWMIGFYSSTGTNLQTDTILASDPDFANPMNFGTVPQSFADYGYTITITAVFEAGSTPTQYTVTLNTADANMGTVTPEGATTVNSGASFTATANANDGYHFVAWMSGTTQVSTANPYTFTVTANTTLTATFEANAVEPCDVPTGITATDISGNGATITWDNANVNGWNIQYRTQGANSWSNAASNTNSYTITGLTPSTTYEVQVQADCGNGNTSDWSDSYIFTTTTGLDSWLENSVKVFPNPASSMLNVQWTMGNEAATIEILDVYGKLLHIMSVTDEITTINVSDLANGMYFVRVTMDEGTVTKTFVKQ